MRLWRKRNGGEKVEQEESGKLLKVQLSKKSGEPILGFTSPKGEDQAGKLRVQAKELRAMALKLERMAGEMERKAAGGKAIRLVEKVFRRGGEPKAK
ncbi:MAG TPA: hypothetical protein DEH27_04055 [Deltaproteobacteria bacterium]|nr:hypothetical protein [Deltaproteobacteria bacterium]